MGYNVEERHCIDESRGIGVGARCGSRGGAMKVYLAGSGDRATQMIGAVVRMQWRDAVVQAGTDGRQVVADVLRGAFSLVILAEDTPYRSGVDCVVGIRSLSDVPVVVIIEAEDELLESRALDAGADDVLVMPVSPLRLISRIRAVMRRVDGSDETDAREEFVCGSLVMNYRRRQVLVNNEPVLLTPTEYRLLFLLTRNADRVLPHRLLIERIWGVDTFATADHLKVNISRLRAKLRVIGEPCPIESVRGVGYRLHAPVDNPSPAVVNA